MIKKIISKEYIRVITNNVVINMIDEIMELLNILTKDIDSGNIQFLHAHKNIFVATCEEELDISDRIKIYTYAQKICLDKLMDRKYTKKLRQTIHQWCSKLERRIDELKKDYRNSPDVFKKAMFKSLRSLKERIKKEYAKPILDCPLIDRYYLTMMNINKELQRHEKEQGDNQ